MSDTENMITCKLLAITHCTEVIVTVYKHYKKCQKNKKKQNTGNCNCHVITYTRLHNTLKPAAVTVWRTEQLRKDTDG